MATITTSVAPVRNIHATHALEARTGQRQRRITPQAGRALEILGHSIEYLVDEAIHSGANLDTPSAEIEAVQLLMALNRQIYFACPEIPTFGERLARAFRTLLIR